MTYVENQPPVFITRDEARGIAQMAWYVINSSANERMREIARNVMSWADGTLLSGENDAYDPMRVVPMTFHVRGYYTADLAEKLDLTPQPVLDAWPLYVVMLKQLAEFIDDWFIDAPAYSTEARLEALGDYDRILARLQRQTAEWEAEIAAQVGDDEDDETKDETDDSIVRSTNYVE